MMCPVSFDSTRNSSSSAKADGSGGGGGGLGKKVKYDLLKNKSRRPYEYDEEGTASEDEEEEKAAAKSFISSSSSGAVPRKGNEAAGGVAGGGGGCKLMDVQGLAAHSCERAEVTTKLSRAIAICVVFMVLETAGGLVAGSLAVLADAAHMLSDVAGFAISLLALHASAWVPTPQQTFGYHRLEVLGALVSVQIIWVMTGIILYEAVQRILFHSVRIVDGRLMFFVACVGLVCNCVVIYVLGHHHHHHHHRHEHRHHHQYDSTEDDRSVLLNGEQLRSDQEQELDSAVDLEGGFGQKSLASRTLCDGRRREKHSDWHHHHHQKQQQLHHDVGGRHLVKVLALPRRGDRKEEEEEERHRECACDDDDHDDFQRTHNTEGREFELNLDSSSTSQSGGGGGGEGGQDALFALKGKEKGTSGERNALHCTNAVEMVGNFAKHGDGVTLQEEREEAEDVIEDDHEMDEAEECCSMEPRDGGSGGALNINLRGAYLHALGDVIQNLGVLITGVVIWIKPEWQFIDLLCSVVFSAIVLMTTLKMLKDIMWVLMESSSRDLDVEMLRSGLLQISGVSDVSDLHVWALTPGTNLLSCHLEIRSGAIPREVLHDATEYCHNLHQIKHVTIQIEDIEIS